VKLRSSGLYQLLSWRSLRRAAPSGGREADSDLGPTGLHGGAGLRPTPAAASGGECSAGTSRDYEDGAGCSKNVVLDLSFMPYSFRRWRSRSMLGAPGESRMRRE
jgi:hypothetical protein